MAEVPCGTANLRSTVTARGPCPGSYALRVDPEICYASNGPVSLAYEVIGEGPLVIAFLQPFGNLEVTWENPLFARFLRGLARFGRVVLMDRRGSGLSDRFSPADIPALEDLVDDITVVLDDAGVDRALLFGFEEAGAQCMLFAASRPERVSGLVLYAATACGRRKPDYPWQWSDEEWEDYLAGVRSGWGTTVYAQQTMPFFVPSHAEDGHIQRWWLRWQRLTSSRGSQVALETQLRNTDVRFLLPTINVPTLVLHRTGDEVEPCGQAHYIASRIPGARLVELPGDDHPPWAGDGGAIVEQVEKFLVEVRVSEDVAERVLATVLFTDIVGSTERAAAIGDTAWRSLIRQLRDLSQAAVERFRGRTIDWAGDGMLAMFDGPARAVHAARAISNGATSLGIEVRAGCHTGEVELMSDGIGGLAVHIGARIAASAGPSQIWVSSTVRDLTTGSGLTFTDEGMHPLKGVPDDWHLFLVND